MSFDEKVPFDKVVAIRESPKALLCKIDEDEHWIPKSQIDEDSEVWREGDEGTLVVSEWIAIEKGLV